MNESDDKQPLRQVDPRPFTRRDFLKTAAATLASLLTLRPKVSFAERQIPLLGPQTPFVEMLRNESESGIIKPDNLPVILLPLTKDFRIDDKKPTKMITLDQTSGLELGYKGTVMVKDTRSNKAYVTTTLWHMTGEQVLPVAILEEGTFDRRGNYITRQKYYSGNRFETNGSTGDYGCIANFYPAKNENLLQSLIQISSYQDDHGIFKSDQLLSYRELIALQKSGIYRLGKTLSGMEIGGGACAGASIFAKAAIKAGLIVEEMWGHRPTNRAYWAGPGDPTITSANSDASVDIDHDFKARLPHDSFVSIHAAILTPHEVKNLGGELDEHPPEELVFTFSFQPERDPRQTEKLRLLLDQYTQYRQNQPASSPVEITDGGDMREVSAWDMRATTLSKIARHTNNEINTRDFTPEIERDPFVQEVTTLAGHVNRYAEMYTPQTAPAKLGTYLQKTHWYLQKRAQLTREQLSNLDQALQFLDTYTFAYKLTDGKPEAIQCVGWALLLSRLGSENCPKYIGDISFKGPAVLIPDQIKSLNNRAILTTNQYGQSIYGGDVNIEDVHVGDLFLLYDSDAGHVGAVVGKKRIGDKTLLLITEGNRGHDGKIITRQISNQSELEAIMGPWPNKIALIRNA